MPSLAVIQIVAAIVTAIILGACSGKPPASPAETAAERARAVDAKGDLREMTAAATSLPVNWFTGSPEKNSVEGVRADLAYEALQVRTGVAPVIVAVVDSGLDISHEDLIPNLWSNPGEIAGNGLDDDQNGFVDDVHGWNFLGGVDNTTTEVTREVVRMKKLKAAREAAGGQLTVEEAAYLEKVAHEVFLARYDAQSVLDELTPVREYLFEDYTAIQQELGVEFSEVTLALLAAHVPSSPQVKEHVDNMMAFMAEFRMPSIARLERVMGRQNDLLNYYLNEAFDPRAEILGDDPSDLSQHRGYGDANVYAGDASHGTHVSGIIGAVRNNGVGIDGVATDVQIMSVRAVPNGDEYDKDVANAIRYAVDNGARVINMSFGKTYSPQKQGVDEAFQYAADHGVLVVHAAGNSALDVDVESHFPNPDRLNGGIIPSWITVGASSAYGDKNLPAVFSNYGTRNVDLFSPGVDLRSTVPGTKKYDTYSGTSMASPVVAGVAALVLSQFPTLTAVQLRDLLTGAVRNRTSLPVLLPGAEPELLVPFSRLSVTGGVVDAYAALLRAGLGTRLPGQQHP